MCRLLVILLAASSLTAVQPQAAKALPEEPVISIYWVPGTVRGIRPHVYAHVYRNGGIVWRDAYPVWRQSNGKWNLNRGNYFASQVSAAKVAAVTEKIRALKLGKLRWGHAIPDSHAYHVRVSDGNQQLHLVSTGQPPDKTPHGRNEKEWKKGLAAWRSIHKWVRELIPKTGRSVPPPEVFSRQ